MTQDEIESREEERKYRGFEGTVKNTCNIMLGYDGVQRGAQGV